MRFHVPENPAYTIVDSAADSLRFTIERCMTTHRGHACSTSSFVDAEGRMMAWHSFGVLEGPGWAANAVGGAYELIRWGVFFGSEKMQQVGLSVLDHVLENGFIDRDTGFIWGYRHIPWNRLVLNFRHNNDWFCPGSVAKVAVQMLQCADLDPIRRARLQDAALGYARWLDQHVQTLSNGWFPRRCRVDGTPYDLRAESRSVDPLFDASADGLFIIWLWTELTGRALGEYGAKIERAVEVFVQSGGIFGSINHDTYDARENVAFSVAFRVLRRVARLLKDEKLGEFARSRVLSELDTFKMAEDRNGVETTGLLWMEKSWDTSYMWENAEAALAWLEAYSDTRDDAYLGDALTVLRAAAKHHHGPHGFLTEGVDWNNHVSDQHHFDFAEFGDIQYTEPFLNNQHIVEPTLYFLEHHARIESEAGLRRYHDHEGNVVTELAARPGSEA